MRKKIYSHRDFVWGVFCLVLALVCGMTMVIQGVSTRLVISAVLLTALGWADLAFSLNRQMQNAAVPDERDRAVSQKSAWKAYQILTSACLGGSVLLMVAYGVWHSPLLVPAFLTLDLVIAAAFVILLGTNLYYERHM